MAHRAAVERVAGNGTWCCVCCAGTSRWTVRSPSTARGGGLSPGGVRKASGALAGSFRAQLEGAGRCAAGRRTRCRQAIDHWRLSMRERTVAATRARSRRSVARPVSGDAEVATMPARQATSATTGRRYGLKRVCRRLQWERSAPALYARRARSPSSTPSAPYLLWTSGPPPNPRPKTGAASRSTFTIIRAVGWRSCWRPSPAYGAVDLARSPFQVHQVAQGHAPSVHARLRILDGVRRQQQHLPTRVRTGDASSTARSLPRQGRLAYNCRTVSAAQTPS